MIRERIGRAALRTYPSAAHQTTRLEMLGTLLDAGEQSRRAFVRESWSLVLGGLRERGTITARAGARRLLADSCCHAVTIWLALWLISALILGPTRQLLVQEVVLAAILACALIGYEQIAAVSGLAALVAFGPLLLHTQPVSLARVLVPTACLLVMVAAPRSRPRDARRLLWLVPVCALAALRGLIDPSLPEVLALISVCGLLRLLHDPRLAIGCGLVWMILLSHDAVRSAPAGPGLVVNLALMAAGLMFILAAGRLWIVRHSAAA